MAIPQLGTPSKTEFPSPTVGSVANEPSSSVVPSPGESTSSPYQGNGNLSNSAIRQTTLERGKHFPEATEELRKGLDPHQDSQKYWSQLGQQDSVKRGVLDSVGHRLTSWYTGEKKSPNQEKVRQELYTHLWSSGGSKVSKLYHQAAKGVEALIGNPPNRATLKQNINNLRLFIKDPEAFYQKCQLGEAELPGIISEADREKLKHANPEQRKSYLTFLTLKACGKQVKTDESGRPTLPKLSESERKEMFKDLVNRMGINEGDQTAVADLIWQGVDIDRLPNVGNYRTGREFFDRFFEDAKGTHAYYMDRAKKYSQGYSGDARDVFKMMMDFPQVSRSIFENPLGDRSVKMEGIHGFPITEKEGKPVSPMEKMLIEDSQSFSKTDEYLGYVKSAGKTAGFIAAGVLVGVTGGTAGVVLGVGLGAAGTLLDVHDVVTAADDLEDAKKDQTAGVVDQEHVDQKRRDLHAAGVSLALGVASAGVAGKGANEVRKVITKKFVKEMTKTAASGFVSGATTEAVRIDWETEQNKGKESVSLSSKVLRVVKAGATSALFAAGSHAVSTRVSNRLNPTETKEGKTTNTGNTGQNFEIDIPHGKQLVQGEDFEVRIGGKKTYGVLEENPTVDPKTGRTKAKVRVGRDVVEVELDVKQTKSQQVVNDARQVTVGPGGVVIVKPIFDTKTIKQNNNILVGKPLSNLDNAIAITKKISGGDLSAWKEIGFDKAPKGFNPASFEWGVAKLPDGRLVIIKGEHHNIRPPDGVKLLNHTHPGVDENGKPHILNSVNGSMRFEDVVQNKDNANKLFPSYGDLGYLGDTKTGFHVLNTPFTANGTNLNPSYLVKGERVVMDIINPRQIPGTENYVADIVVKSGNTRLWSGTITRTPTG